MASPMPRIPPVTKATCPVMSAMATSRTTVNVGNGTQAPPCRPASSCPDEAGPPETVQAVHTEPARGASVVNVRGREVRFALRRWVALVLVVLVAVFIGQNRDRVSIDLFGAALKSLLCFFLLSKAIVGVILGWLTNSRRAQRAEAHRAAGSDSA